MARKRREIVSGGIYHVFARGNDRQLIYRDEPDRHIYLRLLGKVVARQDWECLAYCLMGNHVHLLLETPAADLDRGMQWLHGRYAAAFNRRHGRVGHLFQGRYGAVLMASGVQTAAAAAYICRNPVASGLVRRPDAWAWSSFAATMGAPPPAWLAADRLLAMLGPTVESARSAFTGLVALGDGV